MSNLYLVGFMGVGKSTLGPILAEKLGYEFCDIDHEIESGLGKKISTLFQEKGEGFFRDYESFLIHKFSRRSHQVIALGGGSLLNPENRKTLNATGTLIYLRAPFRSLAERIKKNKENRPLVSHLSEENFWGETQRLYDQRVPFYEEAGIKVNVEGHSSHQIADEIVRNLEAKIGMASGRARR